MNSPLTNIIYIFVFICSIFSIRIAICVLFAFASYFVVAFSHVLWFSLLGKILARFELKVFEDMIVHVQYL